MLVQPYLINQHFKYESPVPHADKKKERKIHVQYMNSRPSRVNLARSFDFSFEELACHEGLTFCECSTSIQISTLAQVHEGT